MKREEVKNILDNFFVEIDSHGYVDDFIVNYDECSQTFIVDYWIKRPPVYILEFTIDDDGNVVFADKEKENVAC